jgi:glycosyltransferase involved in cell wall biosynthesis
MDAAGGARGRTRVVLLAASGQLGGAERVVLESLRAIQGAGLEGSLISLEAGPVIAVARSLGADAAAMQLPAALATLGETGRSRLAVAAGLTRGMAPLIGYVRALSRAVSAQQPALIHSHGMKTHVLAAMLPRRAAVVWHLHDYLGLRSVSSQLLARLARRCDLAIAVSQSVADDARQCLPARVPIAVVHNAVDTDRFRPDGPRADLDAMCGLAPAPGRLLRVGLPATFARWKGQDVFLRALARLEREDVRAYVIGGPLYQTDDSQWSEAELQAMVSQLGLNGKVGFTGFVDDMPAAYRALDVVVHASTRPEPFGLVIPEAMACGRPLIASGRGGAAELFVHGEQGLNLEAVDEMHLAAALRELLESPGRRADMAGRGRNHAVSGFGRERFARQLIVQLEPLLSGLRLTATS